MLRCGVGERETPHTRRGGQHDARRIGIVLGGDIWRNHIVVVNRIALCDRIRSGGVGFGDGGSFVLFLSISPQIELNLRQTHNT